MRKKNIIVKCLVIIISLHLSYCNVFSQDVAQNKIRNKYKIVFISQRDYASNPQSINVLKTIVNNLPHKKKIGIESITIMRSDNDKIKDFQGKAIDYNDPIFTDDLLNNQCATEIEQWFTCSMGEYKGLQDFVFVLNTSNNALNESKLFNFYKVYNKTEELINDINEVIKTFNKKGKHNKTIVIMHYQDDKIDPCINLKTIIRNNNTNLTPVFLDLKSGSFKGHNFVYGANHFIFKCGMDGCFENYEMILSNENFPDLIISFNSDYSTSNNHFYKKNGSRIELYLNELLLINEMANYFPKGIDNYEYFYKQLWNISIRGYGGEKCSNVYGPSTMVEQIQFKCH